MADVRWEQVEPFVRRAYEAVGRVERADVVDLAYDAGVDDDVIDVLDALGSRVFATPEDVRQFMVSQNLVAE
ncbi:MAG TPA: DUF2795 domain-containing protein [Dehalococcoidia bacterium]